MKTIGDALAAVIENAAEQNRPGENDYVDPADGLFHCGTCGKPKQKRQELLGKVMTVPVMCRCREEEVQSMERSRMEDRIFFLKKNGFTDPVMENSRFEADLNPDSPESRACRSYAEHFDKFYQGGKGLALTGTVGTGKTFYASCIANALMEKLRPVLVTSISRYVRGMEGEYEKRNEQIDYLRQYDLVVFDDFGIERNTQYMNELVYAIIDGRIRSGKPMIITTNLTLDVLKKTDDIPVDTARIYDRILGSCIPIPFSGDNVRRQRARGEYLDFKKILGI